MSIDRDNICHHSLIDSFTDGVTDVELEKKLILGIAFASKLFSKTQIVPAEIIVLECTDNLLSEETLPDIVKGSVLNKGDEFSISGLGETWWYRVDGITPSTQTTVVTEDTDFVVRKIDTLETTQMHPPY